MTRYELIGVLSEKTGLSKKETEKFLSEFVDVVTEKVRGGEKVSITGFGTFDLGKRAKRRGRNPQTGDVITIPEMKMPRFRAGKGLKEAVR